jgi:hypothetical protein
MAYEIIEQTENSRTYKNQFVNETYKLDFLKVCEFGNFYIFENPLNMPKARLSAFNQIIERESYGVAKPELISKINNVIHLIETKPQAFVEQSYHELQQLSTLVKDSWDYAYTSQLITALLIVDENEDIGGFDLTKAAEKVKIWMQDPELFDFFLQCATQKCNIYSSFLKLSSQMYLETVS